MECVRSLREGGEYDEYRWAQVMRQQCHNIGIDLASEDTYLVAERLLKYPIGLLSTYVFGESPRE
jgi:hypothetical protein